MMHDRIDIVTYLAVAGLVAALVVFIIGGARVGAGIQRPVTISHIDIIARERSSITEHLGHYPPELTDREKLTVFARNHPRASLPFLLLGELYQRDGRLEEAIRYYRAALELNRGYADPKSSEYRGKQIKAMAEHGLQVYQRERNVRPEDENVRTIIKDLYFIKRSLAGGCD